MVVLLLLVLNSNGLAASANIEYTVHYYIRCSEIRLAEDKRVTGQTLGMKVTVTAVSIAGYTAAATEQKTVTLKAAGNEIAFFYKPTVEKREEMTVLISPARSCMPSCRTGATCP